MWRPHLFSSGLQRQRWTVLPVVARSERALPMRTSPPAKVMELTCRLPTCRVQVSTSPIPISFTDAVSTGYAVSTGAMQTHFDLLGVGRSATDTEIKAAYRRLALKYHPDKPGGDAEKFKSISAAFQSVMKNRGNSTTLFDVWADEEDGQLTSQADAMRRACLNGRVAEVQRLLDAKADVGATDHMGFTALKYACVHDHSLCAELLISHDAAVDQESPAGVTALMEASTMGKEGSIRVLLEYDAIVDHPNRNGQTALMFACANGHDACVRLLCEHGASKLAADADGRRASDFARNRKHSGIAAWLEASYLRGTSGHGSRSGSRNGSQNSSRNASLRGGSVFAPSAESPADNAPSAEAPPAPRTSAPPQPPCLRSHSGPALL